MSDNYETQRNNMQAEQLKYMHLHDGLLIKDELGREYFYTKDLDSGEDDVGIFIPVNCIMTEDDESIMLYNSVKITGATSTLKYLQVPDDDIINNLLTSIYTSRHQMHVLNRIYQKNHSFPGYIYFNGMYEFIMLDKGK